MWAVHGCQGGLVGVLAWPIEAGPWGARKAACPLPDGLGDCVMQLFQEADIVPGLLWPPLLPARVGHGVPPPTDLSATPLSLDLARAGAEEDGGPSGRVSHTHRELAPLAPTGQHAWEQRHLHVAPDCISGGRVGFVIPPSSHHPGCY